MGPDLEINSILFYSIPAQEFWRATYNKNFSSLRRSCAVRTRHVCVTYVLNVDIFPRRSFGAQRTTRIFRPYVDHVRCVRATYAWPTCWMLGMWVEWKQILFWGKTYKNLSIHAEIFPIFPAYKSTLRAGDACVAPTRHVGASKHGENPTTRVV